MTRAPGVDQAFSSLEKAPPVLQGLLRPVLVRALQDGALMRELGSGALSQHLALLGRVLESSAAPSGSSTLPPPKAFMHLAIGKDVDDVEQAYRFVQSLEAPLRTRVEGGLSRAFQLTADRSEYDGVGLVALARLLALAFSNLPFVEHVLGGGAIEPFLAPAGAKQTSATSTPEGTPKREWKRDQPGRTSTKSLDDKASREPSSFVGELVEVVAVVSADDGDAAGRVFVTVGRVLETPPGHILLETLRDDERPGSRLLLPLAQIVAMRPLSGDSWLRAFEAG